MLGERIKELRKNNKYSQLELGYKVGVSKQSVSNWENDNIVPSVDILLRLAKTFNVTTDYLLELDNRNYIEVSNLTKQKISHIQQIVNDMKL